jgi:dihydroorotate dehydrogenase (NAD+) catalytic subunit
MVTTLTRCDLSVRLGPLQLPGPILLASGTCGYGTEMADFVDLGRLGGIITKGLTTQPRDGNQPERIAETPAGMINRIGLQNVGVEAFLNEKLPALTGAGIPIIANIAGATVAEYAAMAAMLNVAPGVAALELNVSCPNVDQGGIEFGVDPHRLESLVATVRQTTSLPLIVKLTPNVTAIGEMARAAEAGGADILSAINTVTGLAIQPRLVDGRLVADRPCRGGLSGPAIKPIALRCVQDIVKASPLPVIGIGGVATLADVLEFLAVGARAVQIGTAIFIEPGIGGRLSRELAKWLKSQGQDRLESVLETLA